MTPALSDPIRSPAPFVPTLQLGDTSGGLAPFISVIVPVRNEAKHIQHTLNQILNQHYDSERFEVIVVDGQSSDGTPKIVGALQKQFSNLHLLANPKGWSSAARNIAVQASRGDILVVVDGHCELDDQHYLIHLAHAFERSGADCVGRPQPLHVPGASVLQRAIALARSSRLGHHPESFIYSDVEHYVPPESVAVAYRREVFERVGLFDETFDACEDVEFNHRVAQAGFRCFFTPRVQVRYLPRNRLSGLFRQMVRYGRGRVRLLRKHPDTLSAPCFLPAIFSCGVALGPSLTLISPWLLLPYLGGGALYSLAVLSFSLMLMLRGRDIRLLAWLPLVFPVIHLGAGAGILQELAIGIWARIKNAVGLGPAAEEPAQVYAWRISEQNTVPTDDQIQEYPRSLAG
jgi:succinoglycan biosynthesis protein ExoA